MSKCEKAIILFLASCSVSAGAFAVNPQEWIKKSRQKVRKTGTRQTMVAAVRGVDEPGQVEPGASNFEGVEKMEKRSFSPEKVNQFAAEGKLSAAPGQGGKP